MKSPLKILHLEDDYADAALIEATIQRDGICCTTVRVETRDALVAALEHGGIDLVLSDFSLPNYDGLSAVALVHEKWPEIPVILVSGTMGEELAVDSLKSGAIDYVLKERLTRLGPAVRRAMMEVEDRDERQRLEAQFVESQKMEVVGHLAAGVAHDFNNILSVIMGYNDLVELGLPESDHLLEFTGEIRVALERAAGLTRQLLVFSRRQTVQPVVLKLNDVITDLSQMLRRLIDENIDLTISLDKEAGCINADPGYIGQVLMNLVVNARDAMPNGGTLAITTGKATLDAEYECSHSDVRAGIYVMMRVTDSGTGMTDEVKTRLFEAFFSTKPAGKGTGLGLATCQTIVHLSGGHIEVDSQLGKGTTFTIYFPEARDHPDTIAIPTPTGPLPRGKETLLIVEDEAAVRHLARVILQGQGYQVLSASNGQEALNVVRNHQGTPISLVITDVIMPRMGGKVMADWLKTIDPDLHVLFTSGYTDDALAKHDVLGADIAFLPKPYTPAILIRRVREMLDADRRNVK